MPHRSPNRKKKEERQLLHSFFFWFLSCFLPLLPKVLLFRPQLPIAGSCQEIRVPPTSLTANKWHHVRAAAEEECYLVPLEVGPAARSEALLAAEALQLAAHAEGVALHADLLAPGTHDLHVGRVIVWRKRREKMVRMHCFCIFFHAGRFCNTWTMTMKDL